MYVSLTTSAHKKKTNLTSTRFSSNIICGRFRDKSADKTCHYCVYVIYVVAVVGTMKAYRCLRIVWWSHIYFIRLMTFTVRESKILYDFQPSERRPRAYMYVCT